MTANFIEVDESDIDPEEVLREGEEPLWGGKEVTWGQELTREYTNWIEEQRSWRETVALGDMTYMLNLHVKGSDAIKLFDDTSINNFDGFDVGECKHAVQCNHNGKIISEGVVEYIDEEHLAIQGFPAPYLIHCADVGDYDVSTEVVKDHVYEVIGPNAPDVMASIATEDVLDIPFMNLSHIEIADHDVIAIRHSLAGVPGFELLIPGDAADEVRASIVDAGKEYGLREVGTRTWYTTRIESGLPQGNLDYIPALYTDSVPSAFSTDGSFQSDDITDWYRSPVEFGWGHYADLDGDYPGRDALEREIENPVRKLVTLEWDREDVADIYGSFFRQGDTYKFQEFPTKQRVGVRADEVRKDGKLIGVSTTPGYMYPFQQMLSLTTIDVEYSDPGTEVTVLWGEGDNPSNPMIERHTQKEVSATVAPAPYEDKDRRAEFTDGSV
ncbi:aminomethyltransferase family protein [Halobellus limi]|uniref:Aminomethyl transferase family protein n=1 Tax=Halobellus limi TaxID=699433 RepID=A0A1H6BPX8_9EURY|nr:aminomethyltransferase family protein [Halobellus limi]QCC49403.1 aminomethyl transferase family protein [Halobellus limi]SEG62457.1 aminomethyltransferase [Halobellus limi]